ncbi:MAG: hypothetical protein LUC41_06355 [Clostridiales bacterium]|nr:hypothetical protein [Clostridiales bacterium]
MADYIPEDCTHDCSSCAAAAGCDSVEGERPMSFFDRLEAASEHFEKMGEENFINMLNEAVAALEAEEEE